MDAGDRRSHKLSRSEAALVRGEASTGKRKNPLSVLVTMTMVGGIFAVAGLPAYAITTSTPANSTVAADTADVISQSMVVSANAATADTARDDYRATTPEQLAARSKDAMRAAANAAYLASGARELGDDYPWPYELRASQGGGLSPLNYYYRECVDFVAWRLNRDQGSFEEPFKWVWSNLTPSGGNASQWKYSWDRNGWETSSVPIVGSVAWFGSANHVAYVKTVNADGTILIEEYNEGHRGLYGQRTILASSVSAFLYPPG